ncbi:MAG: hypothetical protein V2A56_00865 [bacterium]
MDQRIKGAVESSVELWKRVWGDSLQSIHLYGSAARGDWSAKTSDVNLLLLVESGDYSQWPNAADVVKRKTKKGFAVPLILSENYVRSSLDVYPMEFLDIKLFHETLHGSDFFDEVTIRPEHLRLQAEREVKGKWVQLRQAALERGSSTTAIRELLAMSSATWSAVFQALLVIEGKDVPPDRKEVIRQGAALANVDPDVFLRVHAVRHERRAMNRLGAWDLLMKTLKQLDHLARFVDAW